MAEAQKSFWISIGAGAVLIVAAAPFAYSFWKNETSDRALIKNELAELNAKVTKSNDALAQLQKTASVEDIAKSLSELNAKIKSTNDTLAAMQKATLETVAARLERLNANVKSANDALANIQKAASLDGVAKELAQLDLKIKNASDAINRSNDVLADIKKTTSLDSVTAALGQLDAKIKRGNDAVAELQRASLSTGSTPAPKAAELGNAIGDLKKRIDDDKAMRGKLADDIAKLQEALKTQIAPKGKAEPGADRNDVVVFYVQSPDAMRKAQAAPAIPPMTVRFEKIGSLDDNGQADMIVQKLKAITKDRTDCAVTVSGYADTLGGDKINLTISKKRAHVIATKLQAAFAGAPVHIAEAAWGERRLQDWTPNNVAREANRRVDVSVNCKPE